MVNLFKKAFYWFIELKFGEDRPVFWATIVLDLLLSIPVLILVMPAKEAQTEGVLFYLIAFIVVALLLYVPVAFFWMLIGGFILMPTAVILNILDGTVKEYQGPLPKWAVWCFCLTFLGSFSLFYFLSFDLFLAFLMFVEVIGMNLLIFGFWTRKRLKQAKRAAEALAVPKAAQLS